ncbi:MAG: CapA family protein [Spirulinaceae cyanobacterium SM2_1_0]|nr:CapA family protein [Spirulinaceae cyanobacterium SM2_1_0]
MVQLRNRYVAVKQASRDRAIAVNAKLQQLHRRSALFALAWFGQLTLSNRVLMRLSLCGFSFWAGTSYSAFAPSGLDRLATGETGQTLLATLAELPADVDAAPGETPQPAPEPSPGSDAVAEPEASPSPEFSPPPEPEPEATPELPPTLVVKAVGDIVPGTNFPNNRLYPRGVELFLPTRPLLQDADVVFGNLETTLTRSRQPAKDTSRPNVFAFRTPPEYADLMEQMGFDVLSIANNHANDFGEVGFQDTVRNIQQEGMAAVGTAGDPVFTEHNGLRVAWFAYSHTGRGNTSLLNLNAARQAIAAAEEEADITIVSFHGGAEGTAAQHTRDRVEMFYGENRGNVVQFARGVVASGADLVLGHGPHVPRAFELYNGKLIAYSLGNFMGYRTLSTAGPLAYSLVLEVRLDAEGNLVSGQIHPVFLKDGGIPYPSPQGDSIRLIRQLTRSDFPNTPLTINERGTLRPNAPPSP